MEKLKFKRKKSGGGKNWGSGLDYLLKDSWDELEAMAMDSYYDRHNKKRINGLFAKTKNALNDAVMQVKKSCTTKELKSWFKIWMQSVNNLKKLAVSPADMGKRVIFIENTVQLLRETTLDDSYKSFKKKKKIKIGDSKILKGQSAYLSDPIIGEVCLILSKSDVKKFKKGQVLVVSDTDPSLLPVMAKAKAIITDEGGLLCHAAITAREMKKPCVVGAKIATQVLKDGDLIEINSPKGEIKIIGRE